MEKSTSEINTLAKKWKFPLSCTFPTNCKLLTLSLYHNWHEIYQNITGVAIDQIHLEDMLSVEREISDSELKTIVSTLNHADLEKMDTNFLDKLFDRYTIKGEAIFQNWNTKERLKFFFLANIASSKKPFQSLVQSFFSDNKITFDIQEFIRENKYKDFKSKKYSTVIMKQLFDVFD